MDKIIDYHRNHNNDVLMIEKQKEEIKKLETWIKDSLSRRFELKEENQKYRDALEDIVNTGLCNLPDVRCDDDMFKIAEKALKE